MQYFPEFSEKDFSVFDCLILKWKLAQLSAAYFMGVTKRISNVNVNKLKKHRKTSLINRLTVCYFSLSACLSHYILLPGQLSHIQSLHFRVDTFYTVNLWWDSEFRNMP